MAKAEISWKNKSPEGVRREVYVHCVGAEWKFFVRERRFDKWEELKNPPLEDWMELLDAVQRRVARRLLAPDDEEKIKRRIRQAFPEAKI